MAALPFAAFAQSEDHLACFAVKDSAPKTKYQVTITNATGSQTCVVRTPAKIACVQTAKSQVTPAPPGGGPSGSAAGAFLCYRAKCAKPASTGNAIDQFGQRVITFRASRFLCAPANLNAPPPGSSTTTTLPDGNGQCRFEDGQCRGGCGGNGLCRAALESGACECRTTSCGDASAPQCNGACANADEVCVFDLTDCSCANIP
jgi:hypothetical protein